MKKKKEVLAASFENYLLYDQPMDTSWKSPFSDGDDYHKRVKRYAGRMAELAVRELTREVKI